MSDTVGYDGPLPEPALFGAVYPGLMTVPLPEGDDAGAVGALLVLVAARQLVLSQVQGSLLASAVLAAEDPL